MTAEGIEDTGCILIAVFLALILVVGFSTSIRIKIHTEPMSEETEETTDSILEGVEVKSEEAFMRREITFPRAKFDEMMKWTVDNGWHIRRIGPYVQDVEREDNTSGVNKSSTGEPAEMQVWVIERPMKNFNKVLKQINDE